MTSLSPLFPWPYTDQRNGLGILWYDKKDLYWMIKEHSCNTILPLSSGIAKINLTTIIQRYFLENGILPPLILAGITFIDFVSSNVGFLM